MNMEQLIHEFEPMIYHLLHKYGIRDVEGEFYQVAIIALWRAWKSYDPKKGKFSTYAYFSMQKAFFTFMRNEKNIQKRKDKYEAYARPDSLLYYNEIPFDPYLLSAIQEALTTKQMKWFNGFILRQQTIKQIALQENVTENTVKNWARLAKPKIKKILRNQNYM